MASFGYVRARSLNSRAVAASVQALRGVGAKDVVVDPAPNSPVSEPTASLQALVGKLQPGDRLAVYRLADLGLTVAGLAALATTMHNKGITLSVIGDGFDFDDHAAIRLQTLRAIACATAVTGQKSAYRGRPSKTPPAVVIEARARLADGRKVPGVARELGISCSALYRALRRRPGGSVAA